jgi:hypothetical protein
MKKKSGKIKNQKKEEKEEKEDQVKEVGTFDDFIVMEKDNKEINDPNDLSFLNEWTSLGDTFSEKLKLNKSKKSRFSDLFKEMEDEKKTKKEEEIMNKEDTFKKNTSILGSANTGVDSKLFGSVISVNDSILENSQMNLNFPNNININKINSINSIKTINSINNNINNSININNDSINNNSNNIINNNSINNNINNSINNINNDKDNSIDISNNSIININNNSINNEDKDNNNDNNNDDNVNQIIENKKKDKKIESDEKVEELNLYLDINKVISLEDKRTTVMIKNIPNKFNKDLLLNIFDQHFKGTYNIFVLPTDVNKYKNFGYSFINFTSCYFIPYFYFMFNGKMWNSTNSKKICELTYSKVQGKDNLMQHYPTKILYVIEDGYEVKPEQKYIIPNVYKIIFNKYFPNEKIEEYKFYFVTRMPGQK